MIKFKIFFLKYVIVVRTAITNVIEVIEDGSEVSTAITYVTEALSAIAYITEALGVIANGSEVASGIA